MTIQVNVLEAKTQLSRLLDQALSGEEVIIARAGKPLVRLAVIQNGRERRTLGTLDGKGWIADDFDAPLDEAFLVRSEAGDADR